MIVCSCAVISDSDLEQALIEIMSAPDAPVPTPGVVYRYLSKRMRCCNCSQLVVDTIYETLERLEAQGRICPYRSATAKAKLGRTGAARLRTSNRDARLLLAAE